MPVISGFAYPGAVLTSTMASQWYVDNLPVIGQTGSTYTVGMLDIGKLIRCGTGNPVLCWHPNQISSVARFWMSRANVLNSVSPDVSATDGQAVRRWNGILSGTQANQTTGTQQPIYRATGQSSGPSIEFDGTNDFFELPGASNVLQNKSQAYLIAGCRDTNHTAGDTGHGVAIYSINGSAATRLGLNTRGSGGNNFTAVARRLDADAVTTALSSNNGNYNVLAAHGDYSNGFVRLRVNGSVVASAALPGSGNTSNTTSDSARIGQQVGVNHFPGHMTAVCVVNDTISATDLSRVERYIGLMGGLNIALV